MTIPSAGRITQARSRVERTLTGSCDVQRVTLVSDGMGGTTETTEVIATVACRVAPQSTATENIGAGAFGGDLRWRVTLPAETDIEPNDAILFDGRTLQVIGGAEDRTLEIVRRVVCAEVD